MATEYRGRPADAPADVTLPSDGDDGDAASVNDGLQDLANQIAVTRLTSARTFIDEGLQVLAGSFTGVRVTAVSGQIAASGAGSWIVVGGDDGTDALIATKVLGAPWVEATNPKAFDLHDVVFDPSGSFPHHIAVGEADGTDAYLVTFTFGDPSFWAETANPSNFDLNAITTDSTGVLVAAGEHDGTDVYAIRSTGGGAFAEVVMAGAAGSVCNGLTHGGPVGSEVFVSVGSLAGAPLIWSSPDGTTWTPRTPAAGSTTGLNAVVWNGRVFVAVGDGGEVQTSVDGIAWTLQTLIASGGNLNDVSADADGILMLRDGTTILQVSFDDGVTWDPVAYGNATGVLGDAPWGFSVIKDGSNFIQQLRSLSSR